MDEHGGIIAYLNGGADASSHLGWKWTRQNKGNAIALGVGARRHQIRLANIYGHGRKSNSVRSLNFCVPQGT